MPFVSVIENLAIIERRERVLSFDVSKVGYPL